MPTLWCPCGQHEFHSQHLSILPPFLSLLFSSQSILIKHKKHQNKKMQSLPSCTFSPSRINPFVWTIKTQSSTLGHIVPPWLLAVLKSPISKKKTKMTRATALNSFVRYDTFLSVWDKHFTFTRRVRTARFRSDQSLLFVKSRKARSANYGFEDLRLTHFVYPATVIHNRKPLTPLTVTTHRQAAHLCLCNNTWQCIKLNGYLFKTITITHTSTHVTSFVLQTPHE